MNLKPYMILAALVLAPSVAATPGDLTGDGHTDQQDLQVLEQYLQGDGLLSDEQIQAADIDGDGQITPADATTLKRRLGLSINPLAKSRAAVDLDSSNSGSVVDQKTGKPLVGVIIEVPEEHIRVTTDQDGRFTLPRPVPANRILTARAANDFTPFSLTTRKDQRAPFELQLERLATQTLVLDDRVRHLGDNDYSPNSANAGDFRIPSEGFVFKRRFRLPNIPTRDPALRIGSLIGVDTPDSYRAGQSNLRGGRLLNGLQVLLNGKLVRRITLNGDNILIPLPRWLLKQGINEVTLATTSSQQSRSLLSELLGGFIQEEDSVDYDDMEFAQVVLFIPEEGSPKRK